MSALLLILLSSVLVTTMLLAQFPQWRPFAAITGVFDGARAVAGACMLTIPATAVLSWLIARWVLDPSGLQYLRTPVFVTTALIVVPLVETALRRHGRLQPQRPGFALTALTNPTLLGVAFITAARMERLIDALLFAVAAAAALGVTAGVMALAFMGFTGLIQE
jgi:Na+-translocating ferredoxin:NAD+ oxidoreductase subunit A